MDTEFHVNAALGDAVKKFAHFVLRLRHRHAVSGDDNHFVRGGENCGSLFRRGAANRALFGGFAGGDLHLAESAEQDIREGPVHGFAHDHRKNETGGAIKSTGNDEDFAVEHEA